ncbi:hypothetical protein ACLOJK_022519 [Asimina triloba]
MVLNLSSLGFSWIRAAAMEGWTLRLIEHNKYSGIWHRLLFFGEAANFAAYAFAPAILVTPLGALSIIVSAVLAHFMLNEKLHIFGALGCVLCVVGSTSIVLHAPHERNIESVKEVWNLALEPGLNWGVKTPLKWIQQHIVLVKALDTFNTAVISPVYYVTFTTFTIIASMIMFKVTGDFDYSLMY